MVIAASEVERWVQPDASEGKTFGEATFLIYGQSESAAGVVADADVVLSCLGPASAVGIGNIVIELIGDARLLPRPVANADIEIEAEFTTDDYSATSAVARIAVVGRGPVAVEGVASAVFGAVVRPQIAVAVDAVAEIVVGDFGMDVPIFPMGFPFQFLELSRQPVGDAVVELDNTGTVNAVAGIAEAVVAFDNATPLTLKGTVTMFPFRFPGVFDSTATVRLGDAFVVLQRPRFATAVAVDAVAEVPLTAAGSTLRKSIFPFGFPVVFDSRGYATADAYISIVSDGSAAVVLDADAVVDVSTSMSVDSSAVFPWVFGVIFQ